jgi:hypothetical protein
VSLWLVPEGEAQAVLARLIATLAARLGTPSFAPHVTLLAGLALPPGEVVRRAGALGLDPLVLALRAPEGRSEPFRCLYVPVVPTLRLLHTEAMARSAFGVQDEGPYEPHLSLVYGHLEEDEKAKLGKEIAPELPSPVRFAALEVVRTDGPVETWRRLSSFPVQSPPFGHDRDDS